MNSRPDDRKQVTPEQPGNQFPLGGESKHDQHQWIVRSVNELKEDNSKLNTRIDQVYSHLSDTNNNSTLACAISRIETTMGGVERQLSKLDGIDSKLAEHTGFLLNANQQLSKLDGIDSKLAEHTGFLLNANQQLSKLDGIDSKLGEHSGLLLNVSQQLGKLDGISGKLGDHSILLAGLPDISKKLERLESIDTTVSRVKWFFSGLGVLLTACAGFSWWFLGAYFTKLLEALNHLVLK